MKFHIMMPLTPIFMSSLSESIFFCVRFVEKVNDRWEICICVREGRFDQVIIVSFGITVRISFLKSIFCCSFS